MTSDQPELPYRQHNQPGKQQQHFSGLASTAIAACYSPASRAARAAACSECASLLCGFRQAPMLAEA